MYPSFISSRPPKKSVVVAKDMPYEKWRFQGEDGDIVSRNQTICNQAAAATSKSTAVGVAPCNIPRVPSYHCTGQMLQAELARSNGVILRKWITNEISTGVLSGPAIQNVWICKTCIGRYREITSHHLIFVEQQADIASMPVS